jgi:hypothetical protein
MPTPRACVVCGAAGVWQHPTDRAWLCESHAPPESNRARCACGKPAAWWHPEWREWVCLEHAPSEAD